MAIKKVIIVIDALQLLRIPPHPYYPADAQIEPVKACHLWRKIRVVADRHKSFFPPLNPLHRGKDCLIEKSGCRQGTAARTNERRHAGGSLSLTNAQKHFNSCNVVVLYFLSGKQFQIRLNRWCLFFHICSIC